MKIYLRLLRIYRLSPNKSLAEQKHEVYGIDNINNYYSTKLKEARLKKLKKNIKTSLLNNLIYLK